MNITKKNKIIISLSITSLVLVGIVISYTFRPAPGLVSFTELTRNDPLFYSPFFDAQAFSVSVSNLEKSEQRLKKTALENLATISASYGPEYSELIRNHQLFPTDFLALLPAVSKATDDFIAHPTSRKARALLTHYEQVQKVYEQNAFSMNKAFRNITARIPKDRPLFYFFTDSATSLTIAQNDFNLIYKNSLVLKQEIKERRDCLSGKESCASVPIPTIDDSIISRSTPVITKNSNADFIHDTLPFADDNRHVGGPYRVSSNCWADSSTAQPMYAIYSTGNNTTMMLPKLANQNYYRSVPPKATDVISKKILSLGLQFYNQPESTTYECSDLSFYPEILTLDFMLRHNAEATPEYAHLWNNKFGLLAPALESLADFTNLLESSQRASKDFVLSPQFLFITRSAYSLTYLSFAKSVWRIDEQPQYLISREDYNRMGAPKQFKTLTELQKDGIPLGTIRKSHINQRELIESLVK